MTSWRAVLGGFVVAVFVGFLGLAVPVVGQMTAGLIVGLVAGYLAGGGLGRGAWHGLLAGVVGAFVLAFFVGVGTLLLGLTVAGPVRSLLGGAGLVAALVFLASLFVVDSALAGAIGGVMNARR